jgi:hypothetical protein
MWANYGLVDVSASSELSFGAQSVCDAEGYVPLDALTLAIGKAALDQYSTTQPYPAIPVLATLASTGRQTYAQLYAGAIAYALYPYRLWMVNGLTLQCIVAKIFGLTSAGLAWGQVDYSQTSSTGTGHGFALYQDVALPAYVAMAGGTGEPTTVFWQDVIWVLTSDYGYSRQVPPGYCAPAVLGVLYDGSTPGTPSPVLSVADAWGQLCDLAGVSQAGIVISDNTYPQHRARMG